MSEELSRKQYNACNSNYLLRFCSLEFLPAVELRHQGTYTTLLMSPLLPSYLFMSIAITSTIELYPSLVFFFFPWFFSYFFPLSIVLVPTALY
jgi:hypothetical protein